MNSNGLVERRWLRVVARLASDAAILVLSFAIATCLADEVSVWRDRILVRLPVTIFGGLLLGCTYYVLGVYQEGVAGLSITRGLRRKVACTFVALVVAMVGMLLAGLPDLSFRLGKLQGIYGMGICLILMVINLYLRHQQTARRIVTLAFVVASKEDEERLSLFEKLHDVHFQVAGIILAEDYSLSQPCSLPTLGHTAELLILAEEFELDRIICTDNGLVAPSVRTKVCELRYSGIMVMSLLSLCEELYHCIPLPLVTPQWLLAASGSPQMEYIRKFKRIVDVGCALVGLVVLGPLMLIGMVLVKLSSPGPIIFRQCRCGRLGKPFNVLKLRTMRQDAEKHGAQWSVADDPRVTRIGTFLRKYRIDELPQLINVLRGEMSFIGPRPERPEFVEKLRDDIPLFPERLMVQPGLTGWAQVNYPYGSNVEDARRKLEFDLYYLKHMGLSLDVMIILDTLRIVLRGSLWGHSPEDVSKLIDPNLRDGETQDHKADERPTEVEEEAVPA